MDTDADSYEIDAAGIDWKATAEGLQQEVKRLQARIEELEDGRHGMIYNEDLD